MKPTILYSFVFTTLSISLLAQAALIADFNFAIDRQTGLNVTDGQLLGGTTLTNDVPGGGQSDVGSGAAYATYDIDDEGLSDRPGADGFAMNAEGGYVWFPSEPLASPMATRGPFSAWARIKRTAVNSGELLFENIIGRPAYVNDNWFVGILSNGNFGIAVNLFGEFFDSEVECELDTWYDLGVSYDGTGNSDGTMILYLDGAEIGTYENPTIPSGDVFHMLGGSAGWNRFLGRADRVMFWDTAEDEETFFNLTVPEPGLALLSFGLLALLLRRT